LASSEPNLSLYLHVPFCADKCLYCDFYSLPRRQVSAAVQAAVADQTIAQAAFLLGQVAPSRRLSTIFFGGGTPSALPRDVLARLLRAFKGSEPEEWTVEANPESLDRSFLDLCADAGVTRVSLGVQSLRDEHLRLLRRPATRAETLGALDLLRRHWQGEVSFDFIAGIPGQQVSDVVEDLQQLLDAEPGHISLYQLTCEPGSDLARLVEDGSLTMNDPDKDEALWFAGRETLVSRGFRHYEISNFCRAGKECRHNLRYWRMQPYLGVGPSAVSTLPGGPLRGLPTTARVLRISSPRDLDAFLTGQAGLWGMELEPISDSEFLIEHLMMGFRLEEGISREVFLKRFGTSFEALFPGVWDGWIAAGHAEAPAAWLRLTDAGRMILDRLMRDLRIDETRGLALVWP
jgi:oxygen-independent coproporphyrinogen-3 oxidase